LSRRRRKLRRHGDELAAMADVERRALRIDVKNLRHASEFLAPAFPEKSARSILTACLRELAKLQHCQSELNDRAVAARGPKDLAPLLAMEDGACDRLLGRAQDALKRLHAPPAWWEAG
jgi:CHAD domain-containing protein